MRYRPEIDGLRSVAVVPVVLSHAGFSFVSGGFVGVDIFFVISGYLITSQILLELKNNVFILTNFYERRARRILPALFLIMFISCFFAYIWMVPDELKRFGQSILATTIFSNNILLTHTSGYWDLASEFKPLLHTWSLAVEEQYYLLFPLLMIFGWRFFKLHIFSVLILIFIISLGAAHWGSINMPVGTFYLLPTRLWELLFGSFVAFIFEEKLKITYNNLIAQLLSIIGLLLILFSVFFYSNKTPSPSLYTLAPTVGSILVIMYAQKGTIAHNLLSSRPMVGIGLISYSAYLWHYPLFAFARTYSINAPNMILMSILSSLTFVLAYGSWKYVENPFRNGKKYSQKFIFYSALFVSLCFIAFGWWLNTTRGVPTRIYNVDIASNDDMHISYNERVYKYKKDLFEKNNHLKILVVGNSFGRDFVNMTIENFDLKNIEIVYRDDFLECIEPLKSTVSSALYRNANIIVFANGGATFGCINKNIDFAKRLGHEIFYIGTKQFGYNLNWLARLDSEERKNRFNSQLEGTINDENSIAKIVPKEHFISLLSPIVKDGLVPVTDEMGRLISADRSHLTKHGAIYIGRMALVGSRYGDILLTY